MSSFGCFVFEIWVLRASVFVFECFVFETTPPAPAAILMLVSGCSFNLGTAECSNVFFSNTKHFLVLHSVQLLNANYPRYAELSKEDIFSDMWCVYLIHFKLILSEVFHYNSTIQIEWRVFSHVASIYVNFLEQKKAFA